MSLLKPCTSSGSGISGNGIHESDRDRFIEECSELLSKGENLIDEWAEKGNILEAGSPANGKDDDGPTSTPIPVLASILEAKNNDTGLGLGATATSTVTGELLDITLLDIHTLLLSDILFGIYAFLQAIYDIRYTLRREIL
jgi:hypothetical protein